MNNNFSKGFSNGVPFPVLGIIIGRFQYLAAIWAVMLDSEKFIAPYWRNKDFAKVLNFRTLLLGLSVPDCSFGRREVVIQKIIVTIPESTFLKYRSFYQFRLL